MTLSGIRALLRKLQARGIGTRNEVHKQPGGSF